MRISNHLLDLSKLSGSLYVEFSRKFKDFASFISKVPETVSRKLKLLEDAQLIERNGKMINILDKERLENIFK